MKVSRRRFLNLATSAVALGVLGARPLHFNAPSCIVIGAGLAGLAAALRLRRSGWEVTVVEARSRIGGRVLTHRIDGGGGLHCELGAEWIGASHERLIELAGEFALELKDHRFEVSLVQNGVYKPPGAWSTSERATTAFERLRKDYEGFDDAALRRLDGIDWWTCLRNYGYDDDDLRLRDLFDSTDFGESIRHVSAYAAASEYFESSPYNEMDFSIVGGNSRLVEAFADRVGREFIRLGEQVTAIRQSDGMVDVNTTARTYRADACICTVPSRMLTSIEFDPPLPREQRQAADELQYCRIVKSCVLFDERFWNDDAFSAVSDGTSHYFFHATKDQPGAAGILTCYAVGEKADVLAAQDDRRRLELILDDLEPIDPGVRGHLRGSTTYAWQRDRYTQGAYALFGPGQWFDLRPILQKPHGKVLFAGEHLADWQGFMEGAVVSGEEAAEELLD